MIGGLPMLCCATENFQDLESINTNSEWSKIEFFLEEQTNLFYEFIEDNTNRSSYIIDGNKLKSRYETNYNCLKNYIETGIETGEFAPQYPVSICVNLLVTMLEGLFSNSKSIYSSKELVSEQMTLIKEHLKDILSVL